MHTELIKRRKERRVIKMAIITIDPVTRIEGALAISVKVEEGVVKDAWATACMYRGIEQILVGRDPRDAPVITSRVCGVCHNVHRAASTRAIESAYGVEIPEGARRLRNIEAGIEYVYDHVLHTVALAGPDYSLKLLEKEINVNDIPSKLRKTAENFNYLTGKIYKAAVKYQRILHTCLAILGGRGVFNHLWIPGGVCQGITEKLIASLLTRIKEVQAWVDSVLVEEIANLKTLMEDYLQVHTIGKGLGNFLAYGWLYDPEDVKKTIVKSGVFFNGRDYSFKEENIGETIAHSWYSPEMGNNEEPVYIGSEPTPKPAPELIDENSPIPTEKYPKYSWAKSPRYKLNGDYVPLEVGPLARFVVNRKFYGNPLDLRVDENSKPSLTSANVLSRVMARVQETLWLIGAPSYGIEGELINWIMELEPNMETAVKNAPNILKDGRYRGYGLWEAPRGALGHWVTVNNRKIELYNIIAPTTWNVSPRDHRGRRGPIEEALIGTPVKEKNGELIINNIGRVVRSFDPCLACSVHVFDMDNRRKYVIRVR